MIERRRDPLPFTILDCEEYLQALTDAAPPAASLDELASLQS